MLFAGVSRCESDRPRTSAHTREGREHNSLHRSGGDAVVREHRSEMGILLHGASTDRIPTLGARV